MCTVDDAFLSAYLACRRDAPGGCGGNSSTLLGTPVHHVPRLLRVCIGPHVFDARELMVLHDGGGQIINPYTGVPMGAADLRKVHLAMDVCQRVGIALSHDAPTEELCQRSRISSKIATIHRMYQECSISTSCLEKLQELGVEELMRLMYMLSQSSSVLSFNTTFCEFAAELVVTLMEYITSGKSCTYEMLVHCVRERVVDVIVHAISSKEDANVMDTTMCMLYIRDLIHTTSQLSGRVQGGGGNINLEKIDDKV